MTTSKTPIEGACLCGGSRYRITGSIRGFQYCHCTRCRRFTGSAHAANLFVGIDDFVWTEGEENVGTFMLDGEPPFPTAFCKTCGSSLPSVSSTGRFWVIPAGTLFCDPGMRPERSIFWGSRAPWFRCTSELPEFEELPEDE